MKKKTEAPQAPPPPKLRENAIEQDRRWPKFCELYLESGKAYQAALAAGYPKPYAKAKAYILASRVKMHMGQVLVIQGADYHYFASKVRQLCEAKAPKWNPTKYPAVKAVRATKKRKARPAQAARGGWDLFEDGSTQRGAVDMGLKLLDAYPALKVGGPDGSGDAIPVRIVSSIGRPSKADGAKSTAGAGAHA